VNVAFRVLGWFRAAPSRRFRARRTTVLMVVAFVGSGTLYLQVRSEPTTVQPVLPIFEVTTTTIDDTG
jgi:hypothetical protein